MNNVNTCDWPKNDPLMVAYHDNEWGVLVRDDKKWFEFIVLDTFQAGLSWRTILHKRENFRKAFENFDFEKIADYDEKKISELLLDQGIIRNKLKIRASISNARTFIQLRKEFGSFNNYIWQFVNGKPILNNWKSMKEIPATSKESDLMSEELKKRGFKFVGSTTCYAFMQAGGMVNDHVTHCFRYSEINSFQTED